MNQNHVKLEAIAGVMQERTIKDGRGVIHGVSNDVSQPGKTCTVYDGNVTICVLQLVMEFPGEPEIGKPGMLLDCVFANNLRVVTDGEVRVFWY